MLRPPKPILKLQDASAVCCSLSSPFPFSTHPALLQTPHVHFPPTPNLTSTHDAHSPATYDRAPIVVSPNSCALPKRGDRVYTPLLERRERFRVPVPPRDGYAEDSLVPEEICEQGQYRYCCYSTSSPLPDNPTISSSPDSDGSDDSSTSSSPESDTFSSTMPIACQSASATSVRFVLSSTCMPISRSQSHDEVQKAASNWPHLAAAVGSSSPRLRPKQHSNPLCGDLEGSPRSRRAFSARSTMPLLDGCLGGF